MRRSCRPSVRRRERASSVQDFVLRAARIKWLRHFGDDRQGSGRGEWRSCLGRLRLLAVPGDGPAESPFPRGILSPWTVRRLRSASSCARCRVTRRLCSSGLLGTRMTANASRLAAQITVQARHQRQGIASVGFHLFTVLVPIARPHHQVLHAQLDEPVRFYALWGSFAGGQPVDG
jgi:hypothetical protein